MERRRFLEVSAGTMGLLAGCSSDNSPEQSHTATQTDIETRTAIGSNEEPTVRPTETPESSDVEERLSFGEWWTNGDFAYSVADVVSTRTFYDTFEKNREVKMPDGEKLAFVHMDIKNISSSEQYEPSIFDRFSVLWRGDWYSIAGSFEHPKYESDRVDLDWFKKADQMPRFQGSINHRIESGETARGWVGTVIPSELVLEETVVGYDTFSEGLYEIRWG